MKMQRLAVLFAFVCGAQLGLTQELDIPVEIDVIPPPDTPVVTDIPLYVSGTCVEIYASASKSAHPWVLSSAALKSTKR